MNPATRMAIDRVNSADPTLMATQTWNAVGLLPGPSQRLPFQNLSTERLPILLSTSDERRSTTRHDFHLSPFLKRYIRAQRSETRDRDTAATPRNQAVLMFSSKFKRKGIRVSFK